MSNKTENTVANPMPINCRAMKKLSIVSLPFKISNKYPPKICIFFEYRDICTKSLKFYMRIDIIYRFQDIPYSLLFFP